MRSSVLACAVVLCLCPLATYAEDKDVKKNTEVKVPEMKLKDGGFASPAGAFSVTGGTFSSPTGAFNPVRDFAARSGTFRPSGDFQPAFGGFTVKSGDFRPQGQFSFSGFKLDAGTFSSRIR
jgi:hypothetical protein